MGMNEIKDKTFLLIVKLIVIYPLDNSVIVFIEEEAEDYRFIYKLYFLFFNPQKTFKC